jgi:hypothetical protein
VIKEGKIYGGWRKPRNAAVLPSRRPIEMTEESARRAAASRVGNIHDEDAAKKMGLRGGAVGANILINVFPPLLVKSFGQKWFEQGSLSLYFEYMLRDQEETRAVMGVPPKGAKDAQVDAWMETPDGHKVSEGTAAIGNPNVLSALKARKLDAYAPGELRIFANIKPGELIPGFERTITQEAQDRELSYITDTLDWYKDKSPWGGPICTLNNMHILMDLAHNWDKVKSEGAGLYGAFELKNINGPVFVGRTYRNSGKVIYIGSSPKTEYYWYDSYLDEKDTGKRVAEMRCLIRKMKVDSPLWK